MPEVEDALEVMIRAGRLQGRCDLAAVLILYCSYEEMLEITQLEITDALIGQVELDIYLRDIKSEKNMTRNIKSLSELLIKYGE